MKLFLKHRLAVLGMAIGLTFMSGLALAGGGPEEADAPSTSAASDDSKSALGQFQTETAPLPAMTGASQPLNSVPTPVSPAEDLSAAVSNSNASGANFPKAMTPQDEEMAKKFQWWPTDAQPAPVKDNNRSGYWWWPDRPGSPSLEKLWGNQGFVYVRKIIFDYKDETVQTPQGPMKPSLVIKRIIKNVRVYFDYDKAELRDDAIDILQKAVFTLNANPKADILVTGNADVRGSEQYNLKLGEKRAATVQKYLASQGVTSERIRILSRGKLDALAPKKDIVGMQKDRNAQFMIAEVEEVMIPADKADLFENQQMEEKQELTGQIRVSTKDYVIKPGDTLWEIAKREYGDGKQWKRLYEFNKDVISNPNRPRKGTKIQIPIE